MTYKLKASLEITPTKNITGINTTIKIRTQVRTEAILGVSFLEKKLKTGLKTPVATTPKIIVAKKGAISFPASRIALQNNAIKKTKTALWEIFCSKAPPV